MKTEKQIKSALKTWERVYFMFGTKKAKIIVAVLKWILEVENG